MPEKRTEPSVLAKVMRSRGMDHALEELDDLAVGHEDGPLGSVEFRGVLG